MQTQNKIVPTVLTGLIDLFGPEDRWAQGNYDIWRSDRGAYCFCIMGGLREIADIGPQSEQADAVAKHLVDIMPDTFIVDTLDAISGDPNCYLDPRVTLETVRDGTASTYSLTIWHDLVVRWNDHKDRTKEEVIDFLNAALAQAA